MQRHIQINTFSTSVVVKELEKASVKARSPKTTELLQGPRETKARVGMESLGSGEWESHLSRMLSFEGETYP